ncbi:integrase, catalytic region, zinc finger, CCHC-type containing protein [Tanacetum coccineum]
MEDHRLFTLPCRLQDLKPFDILADLGSCVNIIPLYLFKKLNIRLLEETDHIFGLADETKSYPVGIVKDVEVRIGKLKLLNDLYLIDIKKDPKTPLLVGRGFLATANAVIDCRKSKIAVGEGITRCVRMVFVAFSGALVSVLNYMSVPGVVKRLAEVLYDPHINKAHSKTMHSPKATTEFKILQRQDAIDASLREWSGFLDEEHVYNVFQADQCDAFNSDVDEAPTTQTMFMANLSSTDPIYDEAGPSYVSDILSEVQDHDNYLNNVGEYHEVHEMQNDVQQNYVVDSDTKYTSDSNIIPYEQYVKDNVVQVVQSNVSFMPNDALMMIINDMHEQAAQCVSANEQNKVINESLTAKLARYKEQVVIYEKRQENFKGIQTALVKEVKEMKEIFEQMQAEVEQNTVDKRCANIERKNLLIENENLIADCLSNELLYSVMNAVNTVSRFSEIHDAYTVEQARCLELEAEISKLKHKIQKDDHSELIKQHRVKKHVTDLQEKNERFRIENEKFKQHYKELYDSIKITRAKTIEKTSSLLTENEKLKAQLKGKMQCVTMPTVKPKVLAPETLREIVEEAGIEKPLDNTLENACFYTKRSQELLEYVIVTCPKEFSKRDKKVATTPLNRNKQVPYREMRNFK